MHSNNNSELEKMVKQAKDEWESISTRYPDQTYVKGDPIIYCYNGLWSVPGYIVGMTIGYRGTTITYRFDVQLLDGNKKVERNVPWYYIRPDFQNEKATKEFNERKN